jgi:hypothetical protein
LVAGRAVVPAGFWDNQYMGQLSLFTRSELAAMRDRTRSRNYSPAKEQFRREHARHRDWGLARRHAEKLRRLHGNTAPATTVDDRRDGRDGPAPEPVPVPSPETLAEQAGPLTSDAIPDDHQHTAPRPTPDTDRRGPVRPRRCPPAPARRPENVAMRGPADRGKPHAQAHRCCRLEMSGAKPSHHNPNGLPAPFF